MDRFTEDLPGFRGAVDHLTSVQHVAAGETIFKRGDVAGRVAFVDSGRIRVSASAKHSREARMVSAGVILGLGETLAGTKYAVTAQASSNVTIAFLPRDGLLAFLRENPEICLRIVRMMSEDLHVLYRRLSEVRLPTRRRRTKQ